MKTHRKNETGKISYNVVWKDSIIEQNLELRLRKHDPRSQNYSAYSLAEREELYLSQTVKTNMS